MKFAHIGTKAVALATVTLTCGAPPYGPVGVGAKKMKLLSKEQAKYNIYKHKIGRESACPGKSRARHRWELIEAGKITGHGRAALELEFKVEFARFRKAVADRAARAAAAITYDI